MSKKFKILFFYLSCILSFIQSLSLIPSVNLQSWILLFLIISLAFWWFEVFITTKPKGEK